MRWVGSVYGEQNRVAKKVKDGTMIGRKDFQASQPALRTAVVGAGLGDGVAG